MRLALFISQLLASGEVELASKMKKFTSAELAEASLSLEELYELDKLDMPALAPAFHIEAALWAAQYLYFASQLLMLREMGEDAITQFLIPFPAKKDAEAIYSADLMLRHVPDVLRLAKGLAPDDPLVAELKKTAKAWPFSSVGIKLEGEIEVDSILQHASLQIAYIDRIIAKKDLSRLQNPQAKQLVDKALGAYQTKFWPDLHIHFPTLNQKNESE